MQIAPIEPLFGSRSGNDANVAAEDRVNPTNYDCIPAYAGGGKRPLVHAVIETPAFTRHKYAFEPEYGIMKLKQTLAEGLTWPYDYGFVPETLADDGDPLDVLVLNDSPTFSGCLIEVRVIGAVLIKKNGVENDRLVACPSRKSGITLKTDGFDKLSDVPQDLLDGIERFLVEYSADEGNKIKLRGTCTRKRAFALIDEGRKQFKKKRRGKR
jgi:inorganic pyrophosphatase